MVFTAVGERISHLIHTSAAKRNDATREYVTIIFPEEKKKQSLLEDCIIKRDKSWALQFCHGRAEQSRGAVLPMVEHEARPCSFCVVSIL